MKAVIAVTATALGVVALAGCSSSGSDEVAATSSAAPTSTSTPEPTPTTPALPPPPLPQLQHDLAVFVDPMAPVANKVPLSVIGPQNAQLLNDYAHNLINYGRVTFVVRNVHVVGDQAIADVQVNSGRTAALNFPTMTWQYVDGVWKIADTTTCDLLAFGRISCNR